MDIIAEIIKSLDAHVACTHSIGTPTVYVGRLQVQALKALEASSFMRPSGELKQPSVLGMPLIEVIQDDYLRVT